MLPWQQTKNYMEYIADMEFIWIVCQVVYLVVIAN